MEINQIVLIGGIILGAGAILTYVLVLKRAKEKNERYKLERSARLENERIIREQNVLLEQKVIERTFELQEANEELTLTLSSLKDIQTQQLSEKLGNYIVVDLPDSQRSFFNDLLIGFEDYAKLRGYLISFSVDNSVSNKIAFKFTVDYKVSSVTDKMVRKDIQEYLNKVRSGDSLENMPVLISPIEHDLVLTNMKNRINFLQHSLQLQKNAIEFYNKLISQIASAPGKILQPPSIYIQTAETIAGKSYMAKNSPQAILGEGVIVKNNTLKISKSFNQRKNQIEKITNLLELIKREGSISKTEQKVIQSNMEKVKNELQNKEKPRKGNLKKWLAKAKAGLNTAKLGSEVIQLGKEVYEGFNVSLFE